MSDQNVVVAWIKSHMAASVGLGLVILVVLALLLSSLGGDNSSPDPIAGSTTTSPSDTATPADDSGRPEVSQVDCRRLLTNEELDEAFFGLGEISGPRSFVTTANGETCRHEPNDQSGRFLQIEPGAPSDFGPASLLDGVSGEAVDGIGAGAQWFDDGELGVLSIGVDVADAALIYRVRVGFDDVDSSQRLEVAASLARLALPRFPGMAPTAPAPLAEICDLISDEDAEQILSEFRGASPATRDEIHVTGNVAGPVDFGDEGDGRCTKLILAEIYIEAQQGSMSDFEPGAVMEGVPGEQLEGFGTEAVWFPDVPHQGRFTGPHERGVLAVRAGQAMFRIVIAVPDTPAAEQLDIVEPLAVAAASRIPGVPDIELPPEPLIVMFDEQPPDLPPQDLYDVLTRGIAERGFTEGEALIAALGWMLDGTTDFVEGELPDPSRTSVMRAAQAYVTGDGPDAEQVAQLLDELLPDLVDSGTDTAAGTFGVFSAGVTAQAESEEACPDEPCFIMPINEYGFDDESKHTVWLELGSRWPSDSVAIDAFAKAVQTFESLGTMPATRLILEAGDVGIFALSLDDSAEQCIVLVGDAMIDLPTDDLLQIIAQETAHCFINRDLVNQLFQNPNRWLQDGLAVYLGGVVYPTLNLEHQLLPAQLRQIELTSTMAQRRTTNWIYWEYLDQFGSPAGILETLRVLPGEGDLVASFAATPGLDNRFHGLGQALSDGSVPDIGGGIVAFDPDSFQVILAGPTEFESTVTRLATKRYRLEVPAGQFACDVEVEAESAQVSWRSGPPRTQGDWSSEVPDTLEGTSVLLVTSVEQEATVSFSVGDVDDNPDCEEDDDDGTDGPPGDQPSQGNSALDAVLELCEAICDPSGYYWPPQDF